MQHTGILDQGYKERSVKSVISKISTNIKIAILTHSSCNSFKTAGILVADGGRALIRGSTVDVNHTHTHIYVGTETKNKLLGTHINNYNSFNNLQVNIK